MKIESNNNDSNQNDTQQRNVFDKDILKEKLKHLVDEKLSKEEDVEKVLTSNSKSKILKNANLLIRGNIIQFYYSSIQISNITQIRGGKIPKSTGLLKAGVAIFA